MGGVPVEAGACPVIAHGGARAGVGSGLLHVTEWYPGIGGGGNERVPWRAGADVLADPSSLGRTADDPGGAVRD